MANSKNTQILLVEDCPEDEARIRAAFDESSWHVCDLIPAGSFCEARDFLACHAFDAILLNLSLPDGETLLDTFTTLHGMAGGAPVIVLADEEDEPLALTLLREGAQEVVVKADLEPRLLARLLRHSMERQRRSKAVEAVSFFDELTGLYNDRGFAALAEHDAGMARRTRVPMLLSVVEIAGFPGDARQARDLIMVRAAEFLNACFAGNAVLGRIGECKFGVCSLAFTETGLEHIIHLFERELDSPSQSRRRYPVELRLGSATYSAERPGGLSELLAEAESRLAPKIGMVAI